MRYFLLLIMFINLTVSLDSFGQNKFRMSKYELKNKYEESCKRGEQAGCYMLGKLYDRFKKHKKAEEIWKKACAKPPSSSSSSRTGLRCVILVCR